MKVSIVELRRAILLDALDSKISDLEVVALARWLSTFATQSTICGPITHREVMDIYRKARSGPDSGQRSVALFCLENNNKAPIVKIRFRGNSTLSDVERCYWLKRVTLSSREESANSANSVEIAFFELEPESKVRWMFFPDWESYEKSFFALPPTI